MAYARWVCSATYAAGSLTERRWWLPVPRRLDRPDPAVGGDLLDGPGLPVRHAQLGVVAAGLDHVAGTDRQPVAAVGDVHVVDRTASYAHVSNQAARTAASGTRTVELADGTFVVGPPKTAAGRRVVAVPAVILPDVIEHLRRYTGEGAGAYVFVGKRGGMLRRSNFQAIWRAALSKAGIEGVHFHDLRHTGNTLTAQAGATLPDLMARMGHASARAALIYLHTSSTRDRAVAHALDGLVQQNGHAAGTTPGSLVPRGCRRDRTPVLTCGDAGSG